MMLSLLIASRRIIIEKIWEELIFALDCLFLKLDWWMFMMMNA